MPRIASFEKREWINPHDDRRPMTDDWVLVTIVDPVRKYVTMARYKEITVKLVNKKEDGWCYINEDEEVAAWMPLPEAYDGDHKPE